MKKKPGTRSAEKRILKPQDLPASKGGAAKIRGGLDGKGNDVCRTAIDVNKGMQSLLIGGG